MLNGDRITLRPIKLDDHSFFFKWLNDSKVTRFINFYMPVSEMAERKWVEEYGQRSSAAEAMFVIEEKNKSKPIGFCVISKINHKDRNAEFTIVIGEQEFQCKGLGTEAGMLIIRYAFDQLNMHRIYTGVYKFNKKSLCMVKKLGFKKEGCQRQAVYKNGSYHDILLFGLLNTKEL